MQNILDLVFANDDSLATKLEVTAGISDQDMVLFDLLVHALKGKGCRSGKSSLGTKTLPSQWKEASICGVFKKGRRSNPEYYRPIPLTCTVYKYVKSWNTFFMVRRSALVNIRRKALSSSVGFRKRMTSRSHCGSSCDSCKLRFDRPL